MSATGHGKERSTVSRCGCCLQNSEVDLPLCFSASPFTLVLYRSGELTNLGSVSASVFITFVFQVIQLLKDGKAKEVSYNALASHIISEDGDNPEVGESREVFDLPVVKVSASNVYCSKISFGAGQLRISSHLYGCICH